MQGEECKGLSIVRQSLFLCHGQPVLSENVYLYSAGIPLMDKSIVSVYQRTTYHLLYIDAEKAETRPLEANMPLLIKDI